MPKNCLCVRLTEGALFLQTSENNARRRGHVELDSRPSMLRGLLTLNLGGYLPTVSLGNG